MNELPGKPQAWSGLLARRVAADRTTVFNLLAEVELWPSLFPHIRSARVLRRDGQQRLVKVQASWHGLPLAYTAIFTIDPDRDQVTIRHVSRLTNGSIATWTVRPAQARGATVADGVEVIVRQNVVVPVPLVGGTLARGLVGGRVAKELGQAMLDRLAEVAEGRSLAGRR